MYRESGFSFLSCLVVLLILSALLTFFYLKIGTPFFPISTIKIASDYHRVSKHQLKTLITAHTQKKNFLTLNISTLKKDLLKIPWVQDVRIRRIWPDTLVIKVEEQKPIALLNKHWVMNQNGDIFKPNPESLPQGLPHLIVPKPDIPSVFQYYQKMLLTLKPLKLNIVLLIVNVDGNFKVILNKGMVVLLGKTNVFPRWKRFIASYPNLFQEALSTKRLIKQVDLRYPNGFAVRWQ